MSSDHGIHDMENKELVAWIHERGFEIDWQDTEEQISHEQMVHQNELYKQFGADLFRTLFYLGFANPSKPVSDSIRFLVLIAAAFLRILARNPDIEFLRHRFIVETDESEIEHILRNAPYLYGEEHLNQGWVEQIWGRLNKVFTKEIVAYEGSVAAFFASQGSYIHVAGRVFFHLVENKEHGEPFAFLATYSSGVVKDGKSRHLPLKNALMEHRDDKMKLLALLSTVNKASEKSLFISDLVDSGDIFHPIGLTSAEAYTFLKEIPLYEESGILCRIPNWWKNKSNSLRLSVQVGQKEPSRLGFDALIDFNAHLSIGGETVTVEDLKKLRSEAEGLAFIKGKWVEVNHEKLEETLLAYERAQQLAGKTDMTMMEALRFQLNASTLLNLPQETCELEITNGEWLNSVVHRLAHPDEIESVSTGENFRARLRDYQQKGVAWLHYMKTLGLGACLADDMGLGKTIQIIALLNYVRSNQQEKNLLIVPASLIGNWMSEVAKFAPSLKCCVLHAAENKHARREGKEIGKELLEEYNLFITTYGMLMKHKWLQEVTWDSFILDEAQAIKNAGTKQTKVVKQIKACYKIAMTGTPIENRLSDLWSLFDFLNQGLLGSAKEFTDFTKKLKDAPDGYARLKKIVSPFILRRLKTDKTVIADLPEKIEMKTFSILTKRQAALYSALVQDLITKLQSTDTGMERRGLILSSLMKLKQICNHPDQYLGQELFAETESGKYTRLREICETIYEKRERVLVFTQFREITEPLQVFLETIFHHRGLVLHGGTPVAMRKGIVDKFQGQEYVPFMVLSIKAGGVGLNLTAANHVIHFDRWWNPAVENQATDRAFRIGQQKNVIVHKLITRGTIEEKIDLIIEEKIKLSQEIVPDIQENWITEMDNHQLMDLFRLTI